MGEIEDKSTEEPKPIEEPKSEEDEGSFCIVIIPDYGDVEVKRYKDHDEGMQAMYNIHELKALGKFSGDIISFVGDFVEKSDIASVMQFNHPKKGMLELRNNAKFGKFKV